MTAIAASANSGFIVGRTGPPVRWIIFPRRNFAPPKNSPRYHPRNSPRPSNSSKPTARYPAARTLCFLRWPMRRTASGRSTCMKPRPSSRTPRSGLTAWSPGTGHVLFRNHPAWLGFGIGTADLFADSHGFPPLARADLSHRVRFLVDANHRTDRQPWNRARGTNHGIAPLWFRHAELRREPLPPLSDPVLARRLRHVFENPVHDGHGAGALANRRSRSGAVPVSAVADLPIALDHWHGFSWVPMGHPAHRGRVSGDLPGAIAIMARAQASRPAVARRAFPVPLAPRFG